MPPKGKIQTNKELQERLDALEERKIKVGDLPTAALRRELAKEPQNPTELILPHSVGFASLKEPEWKPLILENGWAAYGAPFSTPSYCKDATGFVHVKGLVKHLGVTAAGPIANIPKGYRPSERLGFVSIGVVGVSTYTGMRIDVVEATNGTFPGAIYYEIVVAGEVQFAFLDPIQAFWPMQES